MVNCDYCGDPIDYLPFNCRYCRKQFCQKHRIPENHDCSFEFKKEPIQTVTIPPNSQQDDKYRFEQPHQRQSWRSTSRRRARMPQSPSIASLFGRGQRPWGVYGLMITLLIFFILSLFPIIAQYIYLAASDYLPPNFYYYTIVTAMFIPNSMGSGFFGFINLIFIILMLFFVGRTIEIRFGRKAFLEIYILGALITGAVSILIELIIAALFNSADLASIGLYTSWGGIMGLVAFMSRLAPEARVNVYLYFIPIRMKMKNILWFFVIIQVVFGLLSFSIANFASIAGALGGILVLRQIRNR